MSAVQRKGILYMIKKLTALLLCAAVILSAGASAFAMERSIQPLSDTGSIDNAGRSAELVYEGENARAYYGSSGISIVTQSGVKNLGTNFPVKKLLVLSDVNGDGYPDFLTYQNAPHYSAQVMTVSGKDGKVLADLHLTHDGYDDNLGPVQLNSFVQQFLGTADGNALIVCDYSIIKVDADTLEILCEDPENRLEVTLYYTAFRNLDVITRSVSFRNKGNDMITLEKVMSLSVDLEDPGYETIGLFGSWARERHICRNPLGMGSYRIGSFRGESSHQEHPFLALCTKGADSDHGQVYGFHFLYSGNFVAEAHRSQFESVRVTMGISPEGFSWGLMPG